MDFNIVDLRLEVDSMNLPKKEIVVLLLYPVLMFPKNSRLQWCSTMGGTEGAVGGSGISELEERITIYNQN